MTPPPFRWVHHVSDATKEELKPLVTIPLMAEKPQHTEGVLKDKVPVEAAQKAIQASDTDLTPV